MRVLVVEDDTVLSSAIVRALNQAGYAVDWVGDGEAANQALATTPYDLVVLDIALPRVDGLSVLRRLRDRRSRVPVLILTARDTLEERVQGLDLGADDYMTKPFDLPEFEARVRALIRRGQYNDGTDMTHGRLRLDVAARRLFHDDQPIDVSVRELALIELLLARQGRVVSKEQMIDQLFGFGDDVGSNAIEVYVHRVRKKLEPLASRSARCAAWATCSTSSMTAPRRTLRGQLLRWLLIPLSLLFLLDAVGQLPAARLGCPTGSTTPSCWRSRASSRCTCAATAAR